MSLAPSPSASRGELVLQPAYFTSSLFVEPFRADVQSLIDLFVSGYTQAPKPFAFFKQLWTERGWIWFHLKVFDARTRETFLRVTCRLFVEKLVGTEPPLHRVVALFALYTFFLTQPSETHPPLHSINHIEIAIDTYTELLSLPTTLTDSLAPLAPYVVHTLSELLSKEVFHILPHSSLGPYNPRTLPREVFVPDGVNTLELGPQASTSKAGQKAGAKKGRPSKNEKLKKARDAVVGLEKWLDKTGHDVDGAEGQSPATTHVLISNAPSTSRTTYQTQKKELLEGILSDSDGWNEGEQALNRANMAVLGRLKEIDRRAAERGLEVGGEGGESTGLGRVEKAAEELGTSERRAKGGILGLLEGGGLADS